MRFQLELFVEDVGVSARFYTRALGFETVRREADYVALRRGDAELGLAAVTELPAAGGGPETRRTSPDVTVLRHPGLDLPPRGIHTAL